MLSSITQHISVVVRYTPWRSIRSLSTIPSNPHIFYFPTPLGFGVLSLLSRDPPTESVSIGHTTQFPPTPSTFSENPKFLPILHQVLAQYATSDPQIQAQAAAFAVSNSGLFATANRGHITRQRANNFSQESPGECLNTSGRGGWVHISDLRSPPDYGRIAWPEDIFGSLEVDNRGKFVDGVEGSTTPSVGRYQPNNTYRIITSQGILNLSDFLRGKLIEHLRELEQSQLENDQR